LRLLIISSRHACRKFRMKSLSFSTLPLLFRF
jgi:hypothetical protein